MSWRSGLEAVLGSLLRRRTSPGAILCFHGIVEPRDRVYSALHVSTDEFKDTIDIVRGMAEVVPLGEVLRRRQAGAAARGLVALTFDDAYRSIALPDVLGDTGLPATVFVSPGLVETRPWWDRIDELRMVAPDRWQDLEAGLRVSEEDRGPEALRYGQVGPIRHRVLYRHQGRWPDWAEPVLGELEQGAGVPRQQRIMGWPEIESLAARPGVEIGVHTLSHPLLTQLPDVEVAREIRGCHELLRERLGNVSPILAVPFGLHEPRVLRLSSESGMTSTLTLEGWTLRRGAPSHGVPRICAVHADPPRRQVLRLSGLTERLRRNP